MKRVNVHFSEQAYQALQDLATSSGTSMSETLRAAIALSVWVGQERAAGRRILTETPGGHIREVLSVHSA